MARSKTPRRRKRKGRSSVRRALGMATSAVASEILGNLLPMGKGTMKSKHEMETFDLLKAARAARKNKSEMRVLRFSKNLLEMKSRKVEQLQKGIEESKSTIAELAKKLNIFL